MSRRYDSRTTIFSPEGQLYQVENAMEAISNASAAIMVLAKDGVVLAAEKRVISKLLATSKSTKKMYKIDDHVATALAGIMADANILVNIAKLQAQRYTLSYKEPMPVEQLVQSLCDTVGVPFLFVGYDKKFGFQLYMRDPSGNYGGRKVGAIGANNQAAKSMLKQNYKDDITREEAVQLALKVLSKTTVCPSTFSPATFQPATVRPTTFSPATVRPATFRPATFQPATFRPATFQPATFRPSIHSPATVRPTTFRPATFRLATVRPATFCPATPQPAIHTPSIKK